MSCLTLNFVSTHRGCGWMQCKQSRRYGGRSRNFRSGRWRLTWLTAAAHQRRHLDTTGPKTLPAVATYDHHGGRVSDAHACERQLDGERRRRRRRWPIKERSQAQRLDQRQRWRCGRRRCWRCGRRRSRRGRRRRRRRRRRLAGGACRCGTGVRSVDCCCCCDDDWRIAAAGRPLGGEHDIGLCLLHQRRLL